VLSGKVGCTTRLSIHIWAANIVIMCRLLTTLSFIEEVLPFTDIVPSATIGWLMEYTRGGKKAQGTPHYQSQLAPT
jgi:hypothetical protein